MHSTSLSSNSGSSNVSQRGGERECVRTHLESVDIGQIFACIEGKKKRRRKRIEAIPCKQFAALLNEIWAVLQLTKIDSELG